MTEELFVRRNVPECMGTAWTLMSTNIKRMMRALWIPTIVIAVVCTAVSMTANIMQTQMLSGNIDLTYWLWVVGMFISLFCATVFLDAKIYKLLNLQPLVFCIRRATNTILIHTLLTIIGVIVIFCLASFNFYLAFQGKVSSTISLVMFLVETLVMLILMFVFFIPMIFVLVKYMVEREITLKSWWKNYRMGLKSVGFIASFFLLCAIVLMLIYFIIALPHVIVTIAGILSNQGVAMGDPSGLPSSFTLIFALSTFITSFVIVVLRVWSIFATYYMYASIEAKNGRMDIMKNEDINEMEEEQTL